MRRKRTQEQKKINDLSGLFLENYPARSRFAEAFRTLRTNIQLSFMEREFRSLLVTSAGEEEGKTGISANLSFTMAGAGKEVLMIDADLRKPLLSRLMGAKKSPGLTGLLSRFQGTDISKGTMKDYSISDLFHLVNLQKKTGLLHLDSDTDKIDIVFINGKMKDLNWTTRPEEKKLASVLVKEEYLDKESIQKAFKRHKITGHKLGFTLINMGLINEDDLKGILNIQMMDGFRILLQFKDCEFVFKDIEMSDFEHASFDPLDLSQIYNKVIIGEEELPFIKKEIRSAVLDTGVDNLFILPSGNLPPNPSEILGSEGVSFILSRLKKWFDLLIIDSPPILPASDALILAPRTEGVVFVARAGKMNREMVKKAISQLGQAKVNLLGVVLNRVDIKSDAYYKNYYHYYSKYYGESK